MLSDECTLDGGGGGPSDAPESLDMASKKKKSFHPLRSLKRLFGHGGNSRRRSNNDDGADNSSVLLKARSTTDVVVTSAENTEEAECAFQRASKQISLSADSIFSNERPCESNLPVSAISSEALLHSENCAASSLLQRKDDDDGLPQSPFTLTTTAELFIENGLKDQSEKWPSFDSGRSLLSVDSNENEAEEDFFKEKWMAVSKSLPVSVENEASAADSSFHEELDLNLVQRHSSLTSSAAIHRLAVRPKGKRVSSMHQQKRNATSQKLAVCGKSLPLVKEESGTSTKIPDSDRLGMSTNLEKRGSVVNSLDTAKTENEDSSKSSCATETDEKGDAMSIVEKSGDAHIAKKVNTICTVEKVSSTNNNESDEVANGSEKTGVKKDGEKVAIVKNTERIVEKIVIAKSPENVGQGETGALQKEDLKRENESSRVEANSENAKESSKLSRPVADRSESKTSSRQVPAKQTVAPVAAVVVRQKPLQAVAPSAQEIREIAARRQTLAFTGEPGTGVEKPVSKRSSLVISERPLIPLDDGNTELAQMFSRFQRRSSQKKQTHPGDSNPVEEDNSNSRADENVLRTAANSKLLVAQTGSKEQVSLAKVVPGCKSAGKLVESSSQGTGGAAVGLSRTNQQIKMVNPIVCAEKKAEKSPEDNESSTSGGSEKKPEKTTEKNTEKAKERKREKNTEKNTETAIERSKEKSTALKSEATGHKETGIILNKSENVRHVSSRHVSSSSGTSPNPNEMTKGVKKSSSISHKVTKSPAEKSQPGAATSAKVRSSSQSELMDGGAEVPTKSSSSQATRRGSFTYTRQNDGRLRSCPGPCSDNSSGKESGASAVSDNNGRTKDVQYKPPSIPASTRPASRAGMVPSGSGMVPTGSRMVPLGSGTVPSDVETVPSGSGVVPLGSFRSGLTQDRIAAVPPGSRVVPRVIVGPGAVRPTGFSGVTSKESAVLVAPLVIPSNEKSPNEAKVVISASENSSHVAGSSKESETPTGRDVSRLPPKAAASIRPASGQRTPAGKEGESLVEWVGVARQKTKAWKEGKMDVAEKMASIN